MFDIIISGWKNGGSNVIEDRVISPEYIGEEDEDEVIEEVSLRPNAFEEYIGQDKVKENLKVYISSALKRGDTLDHVLLYGPPGLGKTTLATIIAKYRF